MRGADVVIQTLKAAGVEFLFTLSGNQIMSIFDASISAGVDLIHVRVPPPSILRCRRHRRKPIELARTW